ncbi:MAG: SDR family oxidoreductase [Maricaulaceae bacterium]|jgi:NAD(P)-dependent dehydrogenase (short-subunit alcohol dehydrogenase family)
MPETRVAVITGGARGIGLACARRFHKAGANVVIADVNEEAGAEAADELGAASGRALFVRCDVSERLHVRNLLAETLSTFGHVEVLVNNAGISARGDILELSEEDFDRVLGTNLKGAFVVSQVFARQMAAQIEAVDERSDAARKRYAIVNMSSVNGAAAIASQVAYNASKGGLDQLTRSMALGLVGKGIRVNAVAPGSVNTDVLQLVVNDPEKMKVVLARTPIGRVADVDEVASVVEFLASEAASYMIGQTVYVDGGRMAQNLDV